jgi:hypothetical protein
MPSISLSALAIVLGLGFALPQCYGLANPAGYAAALRKFPRSLPWGIALMLLGTSWFVYNLSGESIADFAPYMNLLLCLFGAVGIGACIFVQDFLAVRGLALVLLLLAKLMVDTGRPRLGDTPWALVIQAWAYLLVIAGMWLTASPWRLRDFFEWGTANQTRIKVGCSVRLAFALFIAALGVTKF